MTSTISFSAADLKEDFLLDPEVTFLNHGSFGATPRPVFEEYQRWQLLLERQPVEFLGRKVDEHLNAAREEVARSIGCSAPDMVFVTNATSGLNVIARSLPLEKGDEILTTDHEYGALDLTWEWMCGKVGAKYIHHPWPLPLTSQAEMVESFWAQVTPRTKVIFLSHISSPTAIVFPVREICHRARAAGILTIVDGAHVPGHIPLDLTDLQVDIYSGSFHKWSCAPKGSAFLYVALEQQDWVESLTISSGWHDEHTFVTRNQWQGTRDVAAFLATPAAIRYQREHSWDQVRERCHGLATQARRRMTELTGLEPITPEGWDWYGQMAAMPINLADSLAFKTALYDDCKIELPQMVLGGQTMLRVSFQGYNDENDLDRLFEAIKATQKKMGYV